MRKFISQLCLAICIVGGGMALSGCDSDNDNVDNQLPPDSGLTLDSNQVAIYYKRTDHNYDSWGLHIWDEDGSYDLGEGVGTSWDEPKLNDGVDTDKGAYFVIDLNDDRNDRQAFGFIVRDLEGNKDCGDRTYSLADLGKEGYTIEGSCEVYDAPVDFPSILKNAEAHLLDSHSLVWNAPDDAEMVELLASQKGGIHNSEDNQDLSGEDYRVTLNSADTLSAEDADDYPGFAGMKRWSLPESVDDSKVKSLLKGQVVVLAKDSEGKVIKATSVQFPYALDSLYYQNTLESDEPLSEESLGAVFDGDRVVLKLWAPTASMVKLQLSDTSEDLKEPQMRGMKYDSRTGIWSYEGSRDVLDRKFYRYQVTVFRRDTGNEETVFATDPYSLTVSENGVFTQIVDLNDEDLKPSGWDSIKKTRPEDIVVYEAHIRDFSAFDKNGTAANNGKYLAFSEPQRASMQHLESLSKSGLTYLQVLPAFDLATIDENPDNVADLSDPFSKLCAVNPAVQESEFGSFCDSHQKIDEVLSQLREDGEEKPQALNNYLRMFDSFNWGYDPFHYTAPEGSYASSADGVTRIKEFREMVKALNGMGLRFAMDVVYNHTNAAGLSEKSVLDKIVPDYYQRLDVNTGLVENSSCCSNTASEQAMMEKLMVDSLEIWAKQYKVDAFRFDLMGLHLKRNMLEIKKRLEAINSDIYLYGEGWNMGFDGKGEAATQFNMSGTGIGTFSDRLRDAVRGGGPFDGGDDLRKNQGFGSGLWGERNEMNKNPNKDKGLNDIDIIRLGMAGNLEEYSFTNKDGQTVPGSWIDYNGQPAGYTKAPKESVNYVSKHDNQTLWDNNQYKLDESLTPQQRMQMQVLSQALPILSQGVPFIHMGAELLRSKSMQRDSYDSGDWFNKVDFAPSEDWNNNWDKGLPREDKDGNNWDLIRTVTQNENVVVTQDQAYLSSQLIQEYLKIRSSSPLFYLDSLDQVQKVVKFHNTGRDQKPGIIVMELDDQLGLDSNNESIIVFVNATNVEQSLKFPWAGGYDLHDVQKNSVFDVVKTSTFKDGTFTVPGRTIGVFVK